jgi:anti-sigma factor RsiW
MGAERRQGEGGQSKPLTHAQAKLLVSMAWDGEAEAEEVAALSEHLRACPECAAAAERLREFLRTMDDLLRG